MDVKKININQSELTYNIASAYDIYDVSAHNDGATFESLSALLSASNLSTLIPTSVRYSGMTIRFIQSSDNKYVQYMLTSDTWSTNVGDWQKIDNKELDKTIFGEYPSPYLISAGYLGIQYTGVGGSYNRFLYSGSPTRVYVYDVSSYAGRKLTITKDFGATTAGTNLHASIWSSIPAALAKATSNTNFDPTLVTRSIKTISLPDVGSEIQIKEGDNFLVIVGKQQGEFKASSGLVEKVDNLQVVVDSHSETISPYSLAISPDRTETVDNMNVRYFDNIEAGKYIIIKSSTANNTSYIKVSFYNAEDMLVSDCGTVISLTNGRKSSCIIRIPQTASYMRAAVPSNMMAVATYTFFQVPFEWLSDKTELYNIATELDDYYSFKVFNKEMYNGDNLIPELTDSYLIHNVLVSQTDSMATIELPTLIATAPNTNGVWVNDGTYCSIETDTIMGKCIELRCNANSAAANSPKIALSRKHLLDLGFEVGDVVRFGCYVRNLSSEYYSKTIGHSSTQAVFENTPQWVELTDFNTVLGSDNIVITISMLKDGVTNEKYRFGKFCLKNETKGTAWIGYEKPSDDEQSQARSFTNPFSGKKLATICDSLGMNIGAPQMWQSRLSKMLGMQFLSELNAVTSSGGTQTITTLETCGQWRARKIAEARETPDVIIIENVNDHGWNELQGSIKDEPYMLSQFLDKNTGAQSESAALQYFEDNISTLIGSDIPTVGTMVRLAYTSNTITITITAAASTGGVLTVYVNSKAYAMNIPTNATKLQIMQQIRNYKYDELRLVGHNNADTCTFVSESNEAVTVTVDTGTTGCSVSVTQGSKTVQTGICFASHDVSTWTNIANWKKISQMSIYSMYKGLLEYLCSTYKNAWIFWWTPEAFQLNWSSLPASLTYADGTPNIYAYKHSSENRYEATNNVVKEICKYYGIPVLDTMDDGCINIFNGGQFFQNNNVHANVVETGAQRWAEAMFRQMI